MEDDTSPLWIYPDYSPEDCNSLVKEFNIHPVSAQVLVSRGICSFEEVHHHLYAKLPSLYSPELFADMGKAVSRIIKALSNNENILIYGDNDVDGITGTVLLVEFLTLIGGNTYYYVPNKNTEKQVSISDTIDYAIKNQCSLLITVDCGITAAEEIKEIAENNIDVIITDHHEPTAKLPHCVATLNPKLLNNTYPNRDLTGVGVAFKLAHALMNFLVSEDKLDANSVDLKQFLDLVALGTVADMGTLTDENRILVRYGLKQFAKTKRIGLVKLLEVCGIYSHTLSTSDITSKIAPRLNSLGRISNPRKGVELLLMHDSNSATTLAKELDENNMERQKIEKTDSDDIESFMRNNPQSTAYKAIVLHSKKWHPGIIPIIAARIAKQYNRPTLIITVDNGIGKGSIRTIPEYPLLNCLKKHSDLLINFGGHDFAAGLTIKEENILKFKKLFIDSANHRLKNEDVTPKLYLNARVRFEDLTFDFLESLKLLEPYGIGNPPPLLYTDVTQAWPPKLIGKSHLKFYLEQDERMLEGIGFGLGEWRSKLYHKNLKLQIAFTPHVNIFLNKASIQLLIKDFKIK